MRRDAYMDVYKKRYGIIQQAEIVHHIFPKDEYPEYAFKPWNLISVSRKTHNEFHDRYTDELTEKGIELLRITARRNGVRIPKKYLESKGRRKKRRYD